MALVEDGVNVANVGANGGLDVNIQDQTSPILITELNRITNTTALTNAVAIDDKTVVIDTTTGFVDGTHITIADDVSNRYSIYHQVGAVAGKTISLDRPIDYAFPAGTQITAGTHEMAVNGSVTPVIFSVRSGDTPTGLNVYVDITRIIFKCITATAVDLTTFGDLARLTNGLVLRRVDGTYSNIFNCKDNGELAGIMYDFSVAQATNPVQGVDGFTGRLTFGGQNKIGVVVRIGPGEDLQAIVQDDLSGLTSFSIVAEGHVVVIN
jgi:hypothetical protein